MNEMTAVWALLGVIAVVVIYVWTAYNALVTLRVRVEEAWSDITIQLKRRLDLVPNLIETVKGYAKHEKSVFEEVTKARSDLMKATGVKDTAAGENMLEGALKSLFAVAEAYPDLKANQNFSELQRELVDTEDKIQAARRFYNGGVNQLNTKIETFPNNLIAGMFKFSQKDFFELTEAEQKIAEKPVEVKF
jgi:LemA protein